MRFVERLEQATAAARVELEADADACIQTGVDAIAYRRFLTRMYGFIAPLERSLADTAGLERFLDLRRLRKHALLANDLIALGVKPAELEQLPQCMSVPWFNDVHEALGWAFLTERSTLTHTELFRRLAVRLPGETAFAASYLKCYFGALGEMWRSFGDALEQASASPEQGVAITEGALAAYRHFRRFRRSTDGVALSGMHPIVVTPNRLRGDRDERHRVASRGS